jgi:putative RNA 2'-phosphotransferase
MSITFNKETVMNDINRFALSLTDYYPFLSNVSVIEEISEENALLGYAFNINKFIFKATMFYHVKNNEYTLNQTNFWSLVANDSKNGIEEKFLNEFKTIGDFIEKAKEIATAKSNKLSRFMTYILRHHPEEFDIILDKSGFCNINDLLNAIKTKSKWRNETLEDVTDVVKICEKQRFLINGDLIRANYGHSYESEEKIDYEEANPPAFLIHGTNEDVVDILFLEGIKSMGRQRVHLSESIKFATLAGQRKGKLVLLKIDTAKAKILGSKFYYVGNEVWLSDFIYPESFSRM